MNNRKKFLITALTLVLILVCAYFLYDKLTDGVSGGNISGQEKSEDENSSVSERQKAFDFAVYDKDGAKKGLSDFKGKPVVLNFWASWCGPCRMEMPEFNEAYKKLRDEVQFMMINLTDGSRETKETADAYTDGEGFEFPIFYDIELDAATAYGAYSVPMTFFIDKDGYLIARAVGAIDKDTLLQGINMIKE